MGRGTVAISGASGFVGGALLASLGARGWGIRGIARSGVAGSGLLRSPELGAHADWSSLLSGCAAVVHAAARVHVMRDTADDSLAEFRRVNVDGTLALARSAARAGVRRFIFLSSVKVNGEETAPGRAFRHDDTPAPVDPYGVSKLEAERGLRELGNDTGMEIVVIRPPLVYGPGVKANFRSMMRWVHRGVPLPFGAIRNKRSFIALDNLVDLVGSCLEHRTAPGGVFLASDGEDLSTPELLERVGRALGRPARLVSVPGTLLRLAATVVGKRDLGRRLCGSLQVDISMTRQRLGWTPPVSVDEALEKTVRHFLEFDAA